MRIGLQPQHWYQKFGTAVVNSRDGGDQPDIIQPCREPRPNRATQFGRPVIHSAGSWDRRTQFRHAERDCQGPHADQRPADQHFTRSTHAQAVVEQRDRAGQDRNNGKRQSEIGKAPKPAQQFLRIAKVLQVLRIRGHIFAYTLCCAAEMVVP